MLKCQRVKDIRIQSEYLLYMLMTQILYANIMTHKSHFITPKDIKLCHEFKNFQFPSWVSSPYLCQFHDFLYKGGRKQRKSGKWELNNHTGHLLVSNSASPQNSGREHILHLRFDRQSCWSKHKSQAPPRGINPKSDSSAPTSINSAVQNPVLPHHRPEH